MPVHNGADYLPEAIESILAQTHHDFEFIIVNDGSRDVSAEVISGYASRDSRIRMLCQERQGVAAALNAGIDRARGSILARMDADDKAHPGRLAHQFALLQQHPDIAAIGSAVVAIDESGVERGTLTYPAAIENVPQAIGLSAVMCHPTAMVRLDLLRQAGGYRPEFEGAEDYDLWLRLLASGRIMNVREPLLHHRLHAGQVSKRFRARGSLALFAARYAADYRLRHGADPPFASGAFASGAVRDCLKEERSWAPMHTLRRLARQIAEAEPNALSEARKLLFHIGLKALKSGDMSVAFRSFGEIGVLPFRVGRARSAHRFKANRP